MIDDAIVLLQIGGLLRYSAALEIIRCRDEKRGCCAYPPGNQRGIGDLANTNLQIDSFFDKIAKPVVQDEINRELFVLLQQGVEPAAEIEAKRDRNAEAHAADSLAAPSPRRLLQRVG